LSGYPLPVELDVVHHVLNLCGGLGEQQAALLMQVGHSGLNGCVDLLPERVLHWCTHCGTQVEVGYKKYM